MRMTAVCLLLALTVWGGAEANDAKKARKAVAAGDHAKALDLFEAALEDKPDDLRLGSQYRQAVIAVEAYERCIAFFEQLVAKHPKAPNAQLNLGYAYVDKIPSEGAITQVLLANTALTHFGAAIDMEDSWLGRFTRGNSYLYWPAIFGRTPLAIADLEKAIELAGKKKKSYHVRPWIGLGDAHWRLEDMAKARQVWTEAQKMFPDDPDLKARLSRSDAELKLYLEEHFDPARRVDTDLSILWEK